MRVFYFTEQPYPSAWNPAKPSLRITIPNGDCDPVELAGLYERYLDEWVLADELGFDVMVNEHHATATCLSSVAAVTLSILARITKRARILTLGYPIANRLDPVRAAEELAMIDVISKGRLEIGFVRGVPYELALTQRPGVGMAERFWEAHDLILKALTTHDGPFDWQGRNFQYRNVNVWPPVYQRPHPPIWITGRSRDTVREIAAKRYTLAVFLSGRNTRKIFDYYREACAEFGTPPPEPEKFAYLGLVAVGHTRAQALQRAHTITEYFTSGPQVTDPFHDPPGYFSLPDAARRLQASAQGKSTAPVDVAGLDVEGFIREGHLFAGTPDEVYAQLETFVEEAGGLGNLLMMGHGGRLSHEDTVDSMTLFANHVLPRLKARFAPAMESR